jgi:nucleotide-binding universal stress UspA family protein
VTVDPKISLADAPRAMSSHGFGSLELLSHLESVARESADRAAAMLSVRGFSVETDCPTGEPVRKILELANDADLVVLGSRGLGAASRLVTGSVSDQVARPASATLVCRRHQIEPE